MAKYDENNNPYSWMPGFLRRFLNLTYDDPPQSSGQSAGSSFSQASYTPATPAARPTWSAPSEPTFKPTNMEGYRPAAVAPMMPPAPVERPAPASAPSLAAGAPPVQIEGYVQPVLYLLRSYARGALPPQGLEAFSRETRATSTDVWNLYSHWVRFQAEEAFRLGRELMDVVIDNVPGGAPAAPAAPARRIKVTVANGNGNGHGDHPAAPVAAAAAAAAADVADAAAQAADDAADTAARAADDAADSAKNA